MTASASTDSSSPVVHKHVIVLLVIPDLFGCFPQPPLDHFFAVFRRARSRCSRISREGARIKIDNRFRNPLLQLSRTLDVDVEYQVLTLLPGLLQTILGGSRNSCRKPRRIPETRPASIPVFELRRADVNVALAASLCPRGFRVV